MMLGIILLSIPWVLAGDRYLTYHANSTTVSRVAIRDLMPSSPVTIPMEVYGVIEILRTGTALSSISIRWRVQHIFKGPIFLWHVGLMCCLCMLKRKFATAILFPLQPLMQ